MTVEELIKILEEYPKDCKVVIFNYRRNYDTDLYIDEKELSEHTIKGYCQRPSLYKVGEKVIRIM